jgi:hypothetical protein
MRRDSRGHISARMAHHWLSRPAWTICRATACGAPEATCRAKPNGTTKLTMQCKQKLNWVKLKIFLKNLKIKKSK